MTNKITCGKYMQVVSACKLYLASSYLLTPWDMLRSHNLQNYNIQSAEKSRDNMRQFI